MASQGLNGGQVNSIESRAIKDWVNNNKGETMPRKLSLPKGMIKRGDTYYAAFRRGGRLVRKRLSTDKTAAVVILNDMRARADKGDFDLLDNDCPWSELKAEFLKWAPGRSSAARVRSGPEPR